MLAPVPVEGKPHGILILQRSGEDGHFLLLAAVPQMTSKITGKSTLTYNDFTPITQLFNEYVAFAVRKESPLSAGADMVNRLKSDPRALSIAIGALQMLLDRGELKDWFSSTEIWIETTIAALGLYLFVVHTATATDRSFLNRDLLKDRNCIAGTLLMFLIGIPLYGTMTLLPLMLQNLMNYPVVTTGLVTAPRGIGTMVAMFLVARLVGRVDTRLIILSGLLATVVSMWQMTGFSLQMGMGPIITSGMLQGFGLGFVFTPLSIVTFSTLPRHIMTQGTAIFSLMRNIGGSIGISVVVALLSENTQIVHSRLVEHLRPDNPLAHAPYLALPYSLSTTSGIAALNAEVTRQAQMVAYVDDFKLMMIIVLLAVPLLLLLQKPAPRAPLPAAAE
jgi:DHA2 family multidrug resistance protein